MFRTHEIKDSRRGAGKRNLPDESDLFDERPDERTMPYFSVVPEQVMSDERYLGLETAERAHYWLFVVHVLWKEGGRCIRHSGVISKKMAMEEQEWGKLEKRLLDCKLLMVSPDGFHLMQADLRAQYLMTLETNNNKRRKKVYCKIPASVRATVPANGSTA